MKILRKSDPPQADERGVPLRTWTLDQIFSKMGSQLDPDREQSHPARSARKPSMDEQEQGGLFDE